MKKKWIEEYETNMYTKGTNDNGSALIIRIPGNTSCSQNLKVAMNFAIKNLREGLISVLFVITCQNWFSPSGIRMNNQAYTSYPFECEYLFREGCHFNVLDV